MGLPGPVDPHRVPGPAARPAPLRPSDPGGTDADGRRNTGSLPSTVVIDLASAGNHLTPSHKVIDFDPWSGAGRSANADSDGRFTTYNRFGALTDHGPLRRGEHVDLYV